MAHLISLFSRNLRKIALVFSAFILVIGSVITLQAMAADDEIIRSQITVDGIQLSGMNRDEVSEVLNTHVKELFSAPIVITVNGNEHIYTAENLGLRYDVSATLDRIFDVNEHGQFAFLSFFRDMFTTREFTTVYSIDEEQLVMTLSQLPEIKTPVNADFALKDGVWSVVPDSIGKDADVRVVITSIKDEVLQLDKTEYTVTTFEVPPSFSSQDAETLLPRIEQLTSQPHVLNVAFGPAVLHFDIDWKSTVDWIEISHKDTAWNAELNKQKLISYLVEIAPQFERESRDSVVRGYNEVNGRIFADSETVVSDGIRLNTEKSLEAIIENVANGVVETELTVDVIKGKVITPEDSPYNFPDLLSVGMSNYATSSNDRIHNIKLGLSKVNNRVILPGQEFKINEHLMPITNEAGYANELAIFGGGGLAKVPGGGLCQVSTTVFRAFYNGGFLIKERYPHSLYVHYYTAYQDGLDATIYPGYGTWAGKDLRIINDTPHPILIQTETIDNVDDAIVRIYGTSDGRKVEISGPEYLKNTWIGTEYVQDPNLPVGYEKVEALGQYGKLIKWDRKITYNDGIVNDEETYSRYNAKKRVVRVGTGE